MEAFSALLAICAGNSPVPGEFPAQRPVTPSFDGLFNCVWLNGCVKREADGLRRYRAHYDVTIMTITNLCYDCCIYVFCKWMMKWYWLGKLLGIQSIYILRTNQGFDYFKSRLLHAIGWIPGDGRLIYSCEYPICTNLRMKKNRPIWHTTLLPRFCTALQISICYYVVTSQHC